MVDITDLYLYKQKPKFLAIHVCNDLYILKKHLIQYFYIHFLFTKTKWQALQTEELTLLNIDLITM